MNILFVAYGDFYCNSSIHVFGFANQQSVANLGTPLFRALTFDEVTAGAPLFDNSGNADVIHCWTPREVVRKFAEPLREKWRCKLAIHLEDNEERFIEEFMKAPLAELRKFDVGELDKRVRGDLSHPIRFLRFLESAD